MPLLRLVIAWLIVAALPLQGLAAASVLLCDQAAHSTAQQQSGHDHAAHGHGSDAGHSAQDVAQAQADTHGNKAPTGGDGHACPICASCCNLVALHHAPSLSLGDARPAPPPHQGPSRVATREAPTPDKPPRA